jgi:hypothetical protein
MPTLNDVLAGSQAQAVQVQQIVDALKGTPNKGVPIALVSLNDPNNYALTVQNDDPVNSRALSVLKADGTTLISADATGVTLGSPVHLPVGSVTSSMIADGTIATADIADSSVTRAKIAAHAVTHAVYDVAQTTDLLTNSALTSPLTSVISAPVVTLDDSDGDALVLIEAAFVIVSGTNAVLGWDLQLQNSGTYQRMARFNYLSSWGTANISVAATVFIPNSALPGTSFQVAPVIYSSVALANGAYLRCSSAPATEYLRMTVIGLRR